MDPETINAIPIMNSESDGLKGEPLQCPKCGKTIHWRENLSRHLSNHCGSTREGEKPVCEYCGNGFSRTDNLRKHVRNQHPEHVKDFNANHPRQRRRATD